MHDSGAAERERGFHRYLADLLEWALPRVKGFDGSDVPLYLETLFPYFFVEQKTGWSVIPAPVPTYFRIREPLRRSLEYVLGLSTFDIEHRRQAIEDELAALRELWTTAVVGLEQLARLARGRLSGIPRSLREVGDRLGTIDLEVLLADQWHKLSDVLRILRDEHARVQATAIPKLSSDFDERRARLDQALQAADDLADQRGALLRARRDEAGQIESVNTRLAALEEDLRHYADVQKLRGMGSQISATTDITHCPTCTQPITDTLLSQDALSLAMTVDDNVAFIRSQKKLFERLRERTEQSLISFDQEIQALDGAWRDALTHVEAIHKDITAATGSPSAAAVERRLFLEARINALLASAAELDSARTTLDSVVKRHNELIRERKKLATGLSAQDAVRIQRLTELVRDHASAYGFSTFDPLSLEVSQQTYRVEKSGFEIGFEVSASDAIRLKWAYLMALLELSRDLGAHHPGFVVFDEPRQQDTADLSLAALLRRAAASATFGQQIIVATSERPDLLNAALHGLSCHRHDINGYLIRRIA